MSDEAHFLLLNYGRDYKYSHDYPNHFVVQQFMPDEAANRRFYQAQDNQQENRIGERMKMLWGDAKK